jgi:hypothetical protein
MIHVYLNYLTLNKFGKKRAVCFQRAAMSDPPNVMMMSLTSVVWTVYQQSSEGKILQMVRNVDR